MSHQVSSNNPSQRPIADGATPVGERPSRRKGWLWLLLAALAILLLLLGLSQCGNDDATSGTSASTSPSGSASDGGPSTTAASGSATDSASPSASASSATPAAQPSPSASQAAGGGDGSAVAGTIVTGGTAVLGDGPVKDLNTYTGQGAVAKAVKVQSVPADEGFWVGDNTTDRIWIQLTGTAGESKYTVKQGDTVDFTGKVTPAASGFAEKTGLTAAEGAAQLTGQKQYIAVNKATLKLSE